jgi:GNAT superfamily N-acetyltransferase
MSGNLRFDVTNNPSKKDAAFIEKRLREYNLQFAEDDNHRGLNVFCRKGGEIIGGLLGGTFWHNMYIRRFWLHEDYRRHGIGGVVLGMAETEAIQRGCVYSRFETDIPSALMFYMKHGYSIKFELEDFPPGGISFYLERALAKEMSATLPVIRDIDFEITEKPDDESAKVVEDGLTRFLDADEGEDLHIQIAVICRDGDTIIGGLTGGASYGWMGIKFFWIDEKYRGMGIGRKILRLAEGEAIRQGCSHAHLNTHDFQAPEFYRRMGYRVHSEHAELPPGHICYFMVKDLNTIGSAPS